MNQYDVVVIGGGAAGLSAAIVLSRARRKVLVVDAGSPRNAPAAHMHGYLSRDGMPPAELLAAGRREVTGYGGDILDGTVTNLVAAGDGSPPGECWSPPACGMSCRTSPACGTSGPETSFALPVLSRPRGPRPS